MKIMKYHILALMIFSSVAAQVACAAGGFDEWVQSNLSESEELLCTKVTKGGDAYFVARSGDMLKVGSLIDVSSETGKPKPFVLSWRISDTEGRSLEVNTPQKDESRAYVHRSESIYAENITYRKIDFSGTDRVSVQVQMRVYSDRSEVPVDYEDLKKNELERIEICEIEAE